MSLFCVCVFNCNVNGLMSAMQSQKTLLNPGWVPQSHLSEIKRSSFSDQRKQRWIHFTFLPNCTRCTLEIQFMLSPSIMLGTVTDQASSEEQASQVLCHLDEVQAFLLCYLHKCMEAELQLSNQRSLASLPLDLLDLLWLLDGASPRRLMLRDINSDITTFLSLLPSGRDGFFQRVW